MRSKFLMLSAAALVMTSGVAMAQDAAKPAARHKFTLQGQGLTLEQNQWVTVEVDLSSEDTEGRYSFQDEIWKPGFTVPAHFHKKHAETFHVLSGQVSWTVGGETHVMGAGDTVFIPPNTVHAVHVVGDIPVKILMLSDPGGYEEHMLREKSYTAEQLADPKIMADLMFLGDFNPAF